MWKIKINRRPAAFESTQTVLTQISRKTLQAVFGHATGGLAMVADLAFTRGKIPQVEHHGLFALRALKTDQQVHVRLHRG